MNITGKTYYQKSKLFLLPLLEIPKNKHIKPVGTFVIDSNKSLTEKEYRLILPFEKDESSEFSYYEKKLVDCNYFDTVNYYETKRHRVYIYSLLSFKEDYDKFINGQYTEFTGSTKTLINLYWGRIEKARFIPNPKIDSYLNPTILTYELVSDELGLPVTELLKIKQLLDPPNLEKETFHSRLLIGNQTD